MKLYEDYSMEYDNKFNVPYLNYFDKNKIVGTFGKLYTKYRIDAMLF